MDYPTVGDGRMTTLLIWRVAAMAYRHFENKKINLRIMCHVLRILLTCRLAIHANSTQNRMPSDQPMYRCPSGFGPSDRKVEGLWEVERRRCP
ncbi:hypothetical protein EVAR_23370_1 [Eumeta japonica]|uniref:Uncharacterized protein n=1 Tax=Eumeta variegata TaxID=151549 RepID=A0A4C1VWJ9_EUMVA|nr:hypothetical protein EVAR_23370_1 [Eumeta japonica]